MNKEERAAIYKAINTVSNRVNEMSQKLDEVMNLLNSSANEKISINAGGIDGLTDVISIHDSAIDELATTISGLEVK